MPSAPRAIVWAEPDQEPLLRAGIDEAGLDLVAVGSSTTAGAAALGKSFEVERVADLRQTILRDDVDLLWLAGPFRLDSDLRRLVRERGLRTITNEPCPVSIGDLAQTPDDATTTAFVPLFRRSPGYRAALDALEAFGAPATIAVAFGGGPGEGGLIGRLFDAMDLLDTFAGSALTIDAALAGRGGVPERTEDLHGSMTLNVRFPEGRCACVSASDAAGSWFRQVTLVGAGGWIRIDDGGYAWRRGAGEPAETGGAAEPMAPGMLVGMQIRRLLGDLDAGEAPPETARLLALCEAARLSCRTGEGEAPGRLMEMLSRP